ncbi:hypothetical protein M0805_004507 [Coniferiporia weirii]|nr:hypothetical protein M0805_004507 [Coniferiporia weirii]
MKSFAILSFLAAAAISSTSSLIPSGISSGCSSYLESLNNNATLTSCIGSIVNATSAFGPSGNTSTTPSSGDVNSALGSLCSASSACPNSAIRSQLATFYSACTDELTGTTSNTDVVRMYDVLYTITPLITAACSKDDSGNYCVTQISPSSSSEPSASASFPADSKSVSSSGQNAYKLVQNNLWESQTLAKRAAVTENVTSALLPNTTTYRNSNLAFLFLTPNMTSDALCVPCTRSVLSAYITFEESVPYALGVANSPILGGQPDLYNAVTSTCGSNFMSGAVQAAGGLSNGLISGAVPRVATEGGMFAAAAAAVLGLAALL